MIKVVILSAPAVEAFLLADKKQSVFQLFPLAVADFFAQLQRNFPTYDKDRHPLHTSWKKLSYWLLNSCLCFSAFHWL
jgi:hypothetical protein